MGDQTAWADINPPMVSAQRPAPPTGCSERLRPASGEQFRDELTACLALVAPVGMTEEARAEWLGVAWETVKQLPADLLARGCRKAREICDHPAKIVPAIMAETETALAERRRFEATYPPALPAPSTRNLMDRRGEPMSEADTAELNRILTNLGAKKRYRPDGSKFDAVAP